MRIWLPVVVGAYAACLVGAWGLVWRWHKLSEDWEAIAHQATTALQRQTGIAEGLQAVCRGIGLDITVVENPDGVDIFVTHPPEDAQETRH